MSTSWHGPLYVAKRQDSEAVLVLHSDVEFVPQAVYWEKKILIEALENWLYTLEIFL